MLVFVYQYDADDRWSFDLRHGMDIASSPDVREGTTTMLEDTLGLRVDVIHASLPKGSMIQPQRVVRVL